MLYGGCLKLLKGGLAVLLVVLSGCTFGASALRSNRPAYNQAIQRTEKQELLLNIVRTRFGEPLKFVQVSSIVSSFSYAAGLNANGTLPISSAPTEVKGAPILNLGTGVNYAEAPTVTYVPLEGAQFVSQLLTEAPVDTLLLLLKGGWNIEQLISTMVQRISLLSNDPTVASFNQFQELTKLWRAIQVRGDMAFVQVMGAPKKLAEGLPASALNLQVFTASIGDELYVSPEKGKETYALEKDGRLSTVMQLTYANEEEADRVSALLGPLSTRPKGKLVERFALIDGVGFPTEIINFDEPMTKLVFYMRSFVNQLFHASQGVALGAEDQKVAIPVDSSGVKALTIQQSSSGPEDAFVAVEHRDKWYFIDDGDMQSKLSFNLLLMILALQNTAGGAAPTLTLPVGG